MVYDYDHGGVKRMAAGFFKVHCLVVMDEVQAKKESIVITKHGKPEFLITKLWKPGV